MSDPVRIAIFGAEGRMGRALIEAIPAWPRLRVAATVGHAGSERRVRTAHANNLEAAIAGCDVLIDFTRPEGTMQALAVCRRARKAAVIGTTGFSPEQRGRIQEASAEIAVCLSANFSVGVNVCLRLLEQAARALGPGYDVEIVETHHRNKVDAPSGTALHMGEAVAAARGRRLEECAVYRRHGHAGPRPEGAIGFAVLRAGDVVGEHTVIFAGEGERVEIAHRATSRANFANGALRAAAWLAGRAPGLYSMQDVLAND